MGLWNYVSFSINRHCVKSVRIRSFSGPYFPVFGPNKERYSVSLRIQSERRKILTRKTPNTDTFHAMRGALRALLYLYDRALIAKIVTAKSIR